MPPDDVKNFMATGLTPAMEMNMVGKGSQYAWTTRDANGNALADGKRTLDGLSPATVMFSDRPPGTWPPPT